MKIIQTFENKVRSFASEFFFDKIVVGLSGGADSVALLAALCSVGCNCIAAHCNFMLRGKESERDMTHACKIAEICGAEFESVRFNVPEYIRLHKCSLETACRELRYAWFKDLCTSKNAKWIAVGHHREDNTETFFLNLFRGSGIRGLKGMRPVNGNIIRPLLSFTRKEIEQYLKEKGLDFITDSSNLVADVARNRIRNIVMPIIRKECPHADSTIATTVSNLYSTESFVSEMMNLERQKWVQDDSINISQILNQRKSAPFIIFELLSDKGFNRDQSDDIIRCVKSGSTGKIFKNNSGELYCIDHGILIPMNQNSTDYEIISELIPKEEFLPGKDPLVEYFDASVLTGEKLSVRKWHIGDRIRPFGMKKGSRLISDIMRDAGYSLIDKDNTRLLVKGDEILWIIGLRRSYLYPITENTSNIVRITAFQNSPFCSI